MPTSALLSTLAAAAIVAHAPAAAAALQLVGYSGEFGEWEWTASVAEKVAGRTKEYAGPLTLTHVGICTQDGPETKTGQIRFRISGPEMNATVVVDGVECRFSGRLSDRYVGSMACPERPPVRLNIWLK